MRKASLLILSLIISYTILAQNLWTVFNTSNSDISGNSIQCVIADRKHNKWVGTTLGLCRYTGKTWTDFSMFNEKLKDEFVNCLTVDAKGTLWIGTDNFGVIEFNGSRWTEHTAETKKHNMKFIREIAIDRNDVKWIGVTLGGLVKYDNKEWTKYTQNNSGLLSDFILCVTIDSKNNKWIGTNDGLCVFDDNKWTTYTTANSQLPHNIVPAVIIDKNDVKWLGTLGGLVRFAHGEWTVYNKSNSPLPSNQINCMAMDEAGCLWIGTDQGVAFFDGKSQWRIYNPKNSMLPGRNVLKVAIDYQGNKWFGTDFQGLARFSGQSITGRVSDGRGKGKEGVTISLGDKECVTDAEGNYCLEVMNGTSGTLKATFAGYEFEPSEISISNITGSLSGKNFTISNGMVAKGSSTEKISVEPFLAEGYILIHMESAVAEVEFVDQNGTSVRTIPQYKNGNRITITKMPKRNYTLYIRTPKGEKSLKFNIK